MSAVYCGWATSRQLFPEKVMQQWAPQQQPRLLLLFLKTRLTTSSHGCIRHLPYTLPLGDLLQGHPINKMGQQKEASKSGPFTVPEHAIRATGVWMVVLQTLKQVLVYMSTFALLSLSAHSFFTTWRGGRDLAKLKLNARSVWRAERAPRIYAAFRRLRGTGNNVLSQALTGTSLQ